MANQEMLTMGRKAESIYTTQKKNQAKEKAKKICFLSQHRNSSFENLIRKFYDNNMRFCYVSINGISMPVPHA